MIISLRGRIEKLGIPQLCVQTDSGVGYLVTVPLPTWDSCVEGEECTFCIFSYIREDRHDLFGFKSMIERSLFAEFLNLSGIGPKTAMELCSIPRTLLIRAAMEDDVASLTKIKGVGKKTAEKLLVDLKQLLEKHPAWASIDRETDGHAAYDDDAIAALTSLGYDRESILDALKNLDRTITKTEDRVAAALRSL